MNQDIPDNAHVIALPLLIYGASFLLGLFIHFVLPVTFLPQLFAPWIAVPFILASILIVVSAFRAMGRANTTFDTAKSTATIVTDGAFRYSRNPMYLSLTLLYLGIAALINSLWLLLLALPLMIIIQRGVVEREEQYLERKFGQETKNRTRIKLGSYRF